MRHEEGPLAEKKRKKEVTLNSVKKQTIRSWRLQ
jgi:hypothetical protein